MTEPNEPEVTPITSWKRKSEVLTLAVPSGNVCRARKEGMQTFVKAGLIPNSLMPLVMRAVKERVVPDLSAIERDPQKVQDAMLLMDRVVVQVVVEPRVLPTPREEDPESDHYDPDFFRDSEQLYVDQVDIDDKVFIFQWACGGTSDLEQFRDETDELVGAVPGRKTVARPAKRTAGARKK